MRTAVYPGSFDPITNGHLDIIKRASKIYDKVVVGVLNNRSKNPLFTLQERVEMIKGEIESLSNIEVASFEGLLVDFAKEHNASVIVKGLRTVADFEYEFQMALLNKTLHENIETTFLMTDSKYSYISSSMVKELAGFRGNLSGLVSPQIENKIKQKFNY